MLVIPSKELLLAKRAIKADIGLGSRRAIGWTDCGWPLWEAGTLPSAHVEGLAQVAGSFARAEVELVGGSAGAAEAG